MAIRARPGALVTHGADVGALGAVRLNSCFAAWLEHDCLGLGFLLTFKDGKKVYDAADTGLFGDMRLIGEEGIDLALLPIGDNYTMGPDDSLRAVKLIEPRKVVPIHYNTFPLIQQDAAAWAAQVRKETSAEAVVVKPGEWITL